MKNIAQVIGFGLVVIGGIVNFSAGFDFLAGELDFVTGRALAGSIACSLGLIASFGGHADSRT